MADPFSIVAGTAGLLDICVRVGGYIRKVKKGSTTIQHELDSLLKEVSLLEKVCNAVKVTCESPSPTSPSGPPPYDQPESPGRSVDLWKDLGRMIEHCYVVVERLYKILEDICGTSDTPDQSLSRHVGTLRRVRRRLSKEDDLRLCRSELVMYQSSIQIIFSIINRQDARSSQKHVARSFDDIAAQIRTVQSEISSLSGTMASTGDPKYDMAGLKELQESITSAAYMVAPPTTNKYFDTPQSVRSIFTGRQNLLDELRGAFIQSQGPLRDQFQRRFVVHGMGGSGKTQFCCKFAEENRDRFWGIFWIDASSVENIKKSLGDIARMAGLDPNANAALHWLSNVEERWLLLVDNADDAGITLEDYFPKGKGGHILVTTRNPEFKIIGNVEPRYYDFSGLQFDEASSLLLKASDLPMPWEVTWESLATNITKALGFLALAVIQAGAAIRSRLCSLQTYLDYYDRSWQKLRNDKRVAPATNKYEHAVWVSFEVCYERLEGMKDRTEASDAVELLHTFAFLYREDLSPDILTRAMRNAQLEAEQQEKDELGEQSNPNRQLPTLIERLQPRMASFIAMILGKTAPAPLPRVIGDGRKVGGLDDSNDRINLALNELVKMSLIYYNEMNKTYTMHPVVHTWARKRPRMHLHDQALWADIAGHVLSASILLPPLGSSAKDEKYHASLLTHIEHVQTCRADVASQLADKARTLWMSRVRAGPGMDVNRPRMYAKFSLVYVQCGQVEKAEVLLREVVDFLSRYAGPEDKRTRTASSALSFVYWELGKVEEALALQRGIVKICEKHLGHDHPDTMKAWNSLGRTLWLQGKYTEAKGWQVAAVDGLAKTLGRKHLSTLEAIDDLGRTVGKFWRKKDMEEALSLFSEAIEGMEEAAATQEELGAQHLRTMFVKENLARMSALLGEPYLESALQHMDEVVETRKARMGKEAPWTLLGMGNRAAVLCALGRLEEAERTMLHVLPIAERNFGADHIGPLFGRQVLATIVNHRGRHAEAEEMLVDVAGRQKRMASRRGDFHPDRIGSLVELARCYQLQGKLEESIGVCGEAIEGLDRISSALHPFTELLIVAKANMLALLEGGGSGVRSVQVRFPEHLFRIPEAKVSAVAE